MAGSLPLALGRLGLEVLVIMPKYRGIDFSQKKINERVTVRAVEHEAFFNRHSLYGNESGDYSDNLERFTHFCYTALSIAKETDFRPDVVHVHDWHTALIPALLKTKFALDPFFAGTKTLLTIHNLAYQGHFPAAHYDRLGLDPSLFSVKGFEFYGKVNMLKGGLLFADAINTVSPTYAQEIQTKNFGYGLEGVLQERRSVLSGILNGIDEEVWDPSKDPKIPSGFSAADLSGKALCKADLQKKCGLPVSPDVPLFAVVTRLAEQKGLDLLAQSMTALLAKNLQFVLLGDGDAYYQKVFRSIGENHPKNAKVFIGFNASEAHSIYAGADFFMMPSLFEPCGLGQLIAMRYGTVPVVRRTGGLADTVSDIEKNPKTGNGIVFEQAQSPDLLSAVDRALELYKDAKRFLSARQKGMKTDVSWTQSAKEYEKLYTALTAVKTAGKRK